MCERRDWGRWQEGPVSADTPNPPWGHSLDCGSCWGRAARRCWVGPVCDLLAQGEYARFFTGVPLPGPGLALHPPGAGLTGPSWQRLGLEASAPPGILLN